MARILVLNGPNLNLLGTREPDLYGATDLETVVTTLSHRATAAGHELRHLQSNAEHELVEALQHAPGDAIDFILINPAAFTHTSVAIRDALAAIQVPFIEVHLTNVHAREPFRRHSYLSDLAVGVIAGLGTTGYELALEAASRRLAQS
ncbi:MAG: type II 3-dehydroquinate dehydratase [Thiohalospira sp.]|uniref:type II 3-dehydroquinate dehydratase n=1 Tax=Thiohalospira sp. TaxID=3080549 RepID=UPI003980DD89